MKREEKRRGRGRQRPGEKKKKLRQGNVQRKKIKKKIKGCEENEHWWSPSPMAHWHFCPKMMPNFALQFSFYFGEKTFWWVQRENTWAHHLFSFLPTQPNTLKKVLLPSFSPKFSIHHISPPNKHTLRNIGLLFLYINRGSQWDEGANNFLFKTFIVGT